MIKRKQTKKLKSKKRKNPTKEAKQFAEQIVGDSVEFLDEGGNAEVYYFYKNNRGYVIKLFDRPISKNCLEYLNLLSEEKLIPKIYKITNNYVIMDYIQGKPLSILLKPSNIEKLTNIQKRIIFSKLKNIIDHWHYLGLSHGDLNKGNIIISTNLDVYVIDPLCNMDDYQNTDIFDLNWIKEELEI